MEKDLIVRLRYHSGCKETNAKRVLDLLKEHGMIEKYSEMECFGFAIKILAFLYYTTNKSMNVHDYIETIKY